MLFHGKFAGQLHSGSYARNRIGDLILSERLECTPQMTDMIKHEMIRVLRTFLTIDEEDVSLWITGEPPVLNIRVPILKKRVEKDAETI